MVILFLTSGLEPGKDGVGDFTRLLAAECVGRKQTCYLMALYDLHVSQPVESTEMINGIPIQTLRLPASLSWEERVKLAVDFRKKRLVDWISLHFVSYGFNHKGIVRNLERYFEPIVKGCALHVMFHETWIGATKASSLKARIIGRIQRHYIRQLFHRLRPRLVTTSNAFYVSLLQGIGLDAMETPLFSNIPVSPPGDFQLPAKLVQAGFCDERGAHPDRWMGLFFGALYPEWKEEPFLRIMASAQKKTGKRACLVSAGRQGATGKVRWQNLQDAYAHAIDFITLGECTEPEISALMQTADFGLAATPWHLIGKSSSATTMLDHGLPVIVTNYDFQLPTPSSRSEDPLLHRCDEILEEKLWAGLPRRPARHRGGESADNLIGYFTRLTEAK